MLSDIDDDDDDDDDETAISVDKKLSCRWQTARRV